MGAIASVRLCLDQPLDPRRHRGLQTLTKMAVERRHRAYRILDQVQIMDMENRLCEMLLLSRGDHQLRRRKPAVAVLAPDLDLVDAASEWPSQCLSQPGDRQQYGEGVSVNEHQARVRINRPDRGERKDVVRTFEHPAPTPGRLMLQMPQKPPVKAIGLDVAGFVEPATIARDAVGCVEAETRKDVRGNLGAFLRRCGVN